MTYTEPVEDSLLQNGWYIADDNKKMIIDLSKQNAPVNTGVLGINLTDFFEAGHAAPEDNGNYEVIPDPWEAVIDLAPKTVRIFSGSSAKFMHPLGMVDMEDEDLGYGGYGYSWKEMVTYFDVTNDDELGPMLGGEYNYAEIYDQLYEHDEVALEEWVDQSVVKKFIELFDKCISQPTYDPAIADTPEERPLYINQLIDLIHLIQDDEDNEGLIVDVIYCVNIESQTATELREVLDYLIDNEINIVGVEFGNEVNGKFGELAMGFVDFEHYWKYINGDDYTGLDVPPSGYGNEELADALTSAVESDHDFIMAIKGSSEYWDIKVGLPARNTPDCGALYDFPLLPPYNEEDVAQEVAATTPVITDPDPEVEDDGAECDCLYPDWNLDMIEYYDEVTFPTTYQKPCFDAIIFHTYYNTSNASAECEDNSNWQNIMLALHPDFDPLDLSDTEIDPYQYTSDAWTYSTLDPRLETAFKGITGIHHPEPEDELLAGNFKEFTRDRIDISYEEHAYWMRFENEDDEPDTKEVWITEYNLDDKTQLPSGAYKSINETRFQDFASSVDNSFSHAVMLQNWMLWNLKANYDPDYRDLFLTRATVQTILGGSPTMVMTNTKELDQVSLMEISSCFTPLVEPLYVRRATYFAIEMWKAIHINDLRYLKTVTTMGSENDNLAPSVFIDDDPVNPMLYVFYTNVSSENQWYGFAPNDLVEMLVEAPDDPADFEVTLGTEIDAIILDADQLYSTSGKSPLFDINAEYEICTLAQNNENVFELTSLELYGSANVSCPGPFTAAAPGSVCVELPPVSMGYFTIPIEVTELRKGDMNDVFSIYPNPTSSYFIIEQKNTTLTDLETMDVSVYSILGHLEFNVSIAEGRSIDVSQLPSGVYNIVIKTSNDHIESDLLVKMQ